MSNPPRPDLWYPIAHLLIALRKLLRTSAPEAFAAFVREVRVQIAVITAMLRRYIHVLAAEIVLPHRPAPRPQAEHPAKPRATRKADRYLFALLEMPSQPCRSGSGGREDDAALQ